MKKSIILASFLFSSYVFGDCDVAPNYVFAGHFEDSVICGGVSCGTMSNEPQCGGNTKVFYYCAIEEGCKKSGGTQFNGVSSCSDGYHSDPASHVCLSNSAVGTYDPARNIMTPPSLSQYDNDPFGCIKAGGHPSFNISNPSGVSVFNSSFRLAVERKCQSQSEAISNTANIVAGITGNISGKPDILGVWAKKGFDKLKSWWDDVFNGTKTPKDTMISLPKIKNDGVIDVEIIESPIPSGADGVTPSRSPEVDIHAYNSFLRDEYFPANNLDASGNPKIDMSQLDRFNKDNAIFKTNNTDPTSYTFTPNKQNIWSTVNRPSSSMDELLDQPYMVSDPAYAPKTTYTAPTFRVAPPNSTFYPPVPVKFVDIPTTTTVSDTFFNGIPVKQWVSTRNYPDGSTSQEITAISETYKKGVHTTTTISPEGTSSTTSQTFDIPNYTPNSTDPSKWDIVQTSPTSTSPLPLNISTVNPTPATIDPVTGYPTTTGNVTLPTSTTPTTTTGQDIVNAPMPSYSLPETGEFDTYDKNIVSSMINDTTDTINNLKNQYDAAKLIYDNTHNLIQNGWDVPEIPPGQCGTSLQMNWHGQMIDLCPPITQNLSIISPVISLLVTIAGSIVAIGIFIAGF